jgi:hypothetical protein
MTKPSPLMFFFGGSVSLISTLPDNVAAIMFADLRVFLAE